MQMLFVRFFLAWLLLLSPLGREINADVRTGFLNYNVFLMLGSVRLVCWLIARSLGWLAVWFHPFVPAARSLFYCSYFNFHYLFYCFVIVRNCKSFEESPSFIILTFFFVRQSLIFIQKAGNQSMRTKLHAFRIFFSRDRI